MTYIIILVALVAIVVVVMQLKNKGNQTAESAPEPLHTPPQGEAPPVVSPMEAQALQNTSATAAMASQPVVMQQDFTQPVTPAPETTPAAVYAQPPGTVRDLDDEHAVRPDIDVAALAAARASVSQTVPDEVLKDVLLDATPEQAAQLFSGVSQQVMADAIGQQTAGVHFEGQARDEDLAKLSTLSSAVDDLDIWNFGDDTPSAKA